MKTKNIFIFLLFALSTFIMAGCVKEGPRGPAGQNGIDGNANVIASPWITPLSWSYDTGEWYFDVTSASITSDIVENGAILAYMSLADDIYGGVAVRPLPAYAIGANWDFLIPATSGQIEFTSDAALIPATTGNLFRFILIPSSVRLKSGSINGYKKSELQNMPYKDVCRILGIKE
jgi:hypothetical protein